MQDYDKTNLKRLLALFAAVIIFFLAAVTAKVAIEFWWASIPTSLIAIADAVYIFKKGFFDPEKNEKVK